MAENKSIHWKRPPQKPLDLSILSKEQFDGEIEKGMTDLAEGRVVPSDILADRMRLIILSQNEMIEHANKSIERFA